MAFLVIAGQTIPVSLEGPERNRIEIGKRARSFDGDARSSVRARKYEWQVATKLIAVATADTIEAALEGAPPLAATGDLTGAINVVVGPVRRRYHKAADGEYCQLSFLVQEA